MENFTFYNPVKIIFGRNTIAKIGEETARFGKNALLVYGEGSVKRNGVYAQITESLEKSGVAWIEHSGVKPNPVLSHAREGVEKARKNKCDVIIAAGGGSVIDESKAIAAGMKYEGDLWNFFAGAAAVKDAAPLLTVLTIPATGSEMNPRFVITNQETKEKFSSFSPMSFAKVPILDPLVTMTLPEAQTANGAVDAPSHIIEGYFTTKDKDAPITDELVYAIARSVVTCTDRILADPGDYNARASMMWSATLALNGLQDLGYGGGCFINHAIEHSLSALYDIPHGAGLAIVMPAWFKYDLKISGPERLAKFGRVVFGVEEASDMRAAELTIAAFEKWFSKIGAPLKLSEVKIPAADIPTIAENAMRLVKRWRIPCDRISVEEILHKAQ